MNVPHGMFESLHLDAIDIFFYMYPSDRCLCQPKNSKSITESTHKISHNCGRVCHTKFYLLVPQVTFKNLTLVTFFNSSNILYQYLLFLAAAYS